VNPDLVGYPVDFVDPVQIWNQARSTISGSGMDPAPTGS